MAESKDKVVKSLLASGYVRDGLTAAICGRADIGKRERFHLPETDRYVTVGEEHSVFYRRNAAGRATKTTPVPTRDLKAIREAIVASVYQDNGAPLPIRECAEWIE